MKVKVQYVLENGLIISEDSVVRITTNEKYGEIEEFEGHISYIHEKDGINLEECGCMDFDWECIEKIEVIG